MVLSWLSFLTALVSSVVVYLFALIGLLFSRIGKLERRITNLELALFERDLICNTFLLAYEGLRLLGLDIVSRCRDLCFLANKREPAVLAEYEDRPSATVLAETAREEARLEMQRRGSIGDERHSAESAAAGGGNGDRRWLAGLPIRQAGGRRRASPRSSESHGSE